MMNLSYCSFVIANAGLEKLRNGESLVPDLLGLPCILLYNLESFIRVPLWLIFRQSLVGGLLLF